MASELSPDDRRRIEHRPACPLCGLVLSDRDDVHRHLMVSHRKSTLSDALLDATDAEATAVSADS